MQNSLMDRLPTLEEHNQQRQAEEASSNACRLRAGVACPSCKTEMRFTNIEADRLLPPLHVECPKCRAKGWKR